MCTKNGKCKLAIKGFSLSHKNIKILDYTCVKNILLDKCVDKIALIDPYNIVRQGSDMSVLSKPLVKTYTSCLTKRLCFLDKSYITYPYGYPYDLIV